MQFTVGQAMNTVEEIDALPTGTVLIYPDCNWRYTKQPDGQWLDHTAGSPMPSRYFTLGGANVIKSLPTPPRLKEAHMLNRPRIQALGTLLFVNSEEEYSVYRDATGKEVYLAHGTAKRLVPLDDLYDDLVPMWKTFTSGATWPSFLYDEFREHLKGLVIDPEMVDEIGHCGDCYKPDWDDELEFTHEGGNTVCETCWNEYFTCGGCDERFRSLTTIMGSDYAVCTACLEDTFSWCDPCDGYYHDEDRSEHDHSDCDDNCASPAQVFTVRNDGEGPLANDTRATIQLPAGVISAEGIGAVAQHLRNWSYTAYCDGTVDAEENQSYNALSFRLEELGDKWQTREGNYTKRLSRFAYKEFALKVAPEVISHVGNIGREHSTAIDFEIEVTRDLNLPREEFAHGGSCWWTEYYESRCAFKTSGGYGLRTFGDYGVVGRAWVMPLRLVEGVDDVADWMRNGLTPTFETLDPDAFVVFNGYGNLEGYAPARIVAYMAGMTYRKIGFTCRPMYINNESGYLVAPEEIATHYTDGQLALSVDQHSNLFDNERTLTNA